jgi:hypothetical protein
MERQEVEQIMEMLKTMQEKADANRKIYKEEMMEKMDANMKTMLARMDAMHKKMMDRMDAWLTDTNDNREETMACQETMEACLECKEPASEEIKPEVADEEVPLEDATRMPVREPRKRHQDQNLAAQRRQKKELNWTQNKDGYLKNLIAAHRGMTHRAQVARRRTLLTKETPGYCGSQKRVTIVDRRTTRCAKVWRKEIVIRRNRIRRQPKKERTKGTRSRHVEELLHLRKKRKTTRSIGGRNRRQQPRLETMRNSNEVFGKSIGLGFGKRAAGSPVAVRKMKK